MLICPLIHGRSWCKSNGMFITLQVLTYAGTRRFSTIIMLKPVLPTWRSSLTDNRGEKWLIKGRRCYQCMHTWGRSRPSHSADDTTKFNAYAHDPSHHTHTIPCLHEKDDTGEATRLERKTSAEIFTATTKHAHARTRTHVLALGRQGKDFGIVWQRHVLKQLPLWGKCSIVSSQEELFITIFFFFTVICYTFSQHICSFSYCYFIGSSKVAAGHENTRHTRACFFFQGYNDFSGSLVGTFWTSR